MPRISFGYRIKSGMTEKQIMSLPLRQRFYEAHPAARSLSLLCSFYRFESLTLLLKIFRLGPLEGGAHALATRTSRNRLSDPFLRPLRFAPKYGRGYRNRHSG